MRLAVTSDNLIADALKAVGHPTRLGLLRQMADQPLCVSDLQQRVGRSQANVSQHLAVLRDRGLVVPERRGNMTCYHLADGRIADLVRLASDLFGGPEPAGSLP